MDFIHNGQQMGNNWGNIWGHNGSGKLLAWQTRLADHELSSICWHHQKVWIHKSWFWEMGMHCHMKTNKNRLLSTRDFAKPWFIKQGGTPPIVIIWYFFMVPSQLNNRLGFIKIQVWHHSNSGAGGAGGGGGGWDGSGAGSPVLPS